MLMGRHPKRRDSRVRDLRGKDVVVKHLLSGDYRVRRAFGQGR